MRPKKGPASAAAAWAQGVAGGADGLAWLARAARLAPEDPRITLDLARLRMGGDAASVRAAEAGLAGLAARYDALQIWLALAMARHRLGDAQGAAVALEQLLLRHCLPEAPGFEVLAGRIATGAGYDGYCGMTAAGEVFASAAGRLLAARLDVAALNRVEGLVAWQAGELRGWAVRRAAQDAPPELHLRDAAGVLLPVRFGKVLRPDEDAPFLRRYRFRITARQLRGLVPPFSLLGPDGKHVFGSPLDPAVLAQHPLPASRRGSAPTKIPDERPLAVIIPIYRGFDETRACLEALFAAVPEGTKIILVDDATPEPELAAYTDRLAEADKVSLLRHAQNQGFAAAINTGLAAAGDRDVLLLNSDTLVPPGALKTLREAAYAAADTGSVTPFSNDATILSYPDARGGNPVPDQTETSRLNALARAANGRKTIEIPTAIGFCMVIRHDCLAATGGFRPEIFAQGYGEENDWCLRARHLGYRHVAAMGAYVAHIGGVSFGAAARGLVSRNLAILERLYPGYQKMVLGFIARDPLGPARARMDVLRLGPPKASVLLISHSHGGGVARQVTAQMAELRAQGLRPLVLTTQFPDDPEKTPYPWPALLTQGDAKDYPNLAFPLPAQKPALLRLLKTLRITRIVLHHMLGHHPDLRQLAAKLKVPQDIIIHDYVSFCPRVNLLNRPQISAPPRYCGEPDVKTCIACCARDKSTIYETLPVPKLLARSAREFAAAENIIAPSADAAQRLARHFPGIKPIVQPWEDDSAPVQLTPPAKGPRKILIAGGISQAKGFDLLLDCAADATARNLPLEFIVAGSSADDAKLLASGRIFITGHYPEHDAQAVIRAAQADLAFLPSIWPETWCFTLSETWRAGLYVLAFDLGAPAARIKATGRGAVLPLGLPVPRINDMLLRWMP